MSIEVADDVTTASLRNHQSLMNADDKRAKTLQSRTPIVLHKGKYSEELQ
jgi:hypothetical protein